MPSGASAASRDAARLASLTFFLDHQIGRFQVAAVLRAIGARVEVHLDHFAGNAPDTQWIPEIARRDWVLITKDQNIRRNPIVTGKDMTGEQLGQLLAQCLQGMVRRTAGRPGPLLFTISRTGVFTKLM